MKFFNLIKLSLVGMVFLMSSPVMALITGSAHDFSNGTNNTWNTTGEICVVCHTPHNAPGAASGPLWNAGVTTQSYTLYSSPLGTLDATPLGQPSGASILCLSCHDGTLGVDSFGGGNTLIGTIESRLDFGTDLSDDHPISFTFDDTLASTDGELNTPSTFVTAIGSTIQVDMLFSDRVECASCHDVHNTNVAGSYLLKIDNAGSDLCLTCHNK